jgi:hypothetical protein
MVKKLLTIEPSHRILHNSLGLLVRRIIETSEISPSALSVVIPVSDEAPSQEGSKEGALIQMEYFKRGENKWNTIYGDILA